MGSLPGHALPGSFFIIFGLWWTINQFRRYQHSCMTKGSSYKNSVTFRCFCLCSHLSMWEIEGFLKIFMTTIGFVIEVIWHPEGGLYVTNGQHGTMYFFFGMNGAINILQHHNIVPSSVNYISTALALLVEGLLFVSHAQGRPELDAVIHTLITHTVFLNMAAVLMEMKYPRSLLAGLARSYFTLLQGTWFWQIGFILYSPIEHTEPWKQDDMQHIMLANLMFTWHIGAIFILQLAIGGCVHFVYFCKYKHLFPNKAYQSLEQNGFQKDANRHGAISVTNDDIWSDEEEYK